MPRPRRNPRRKPASPAPQAIPTKVRRTRKLTPLEYLLRVVNDESADPARRDMAARSAAQYCHAKPGDLGKKDAEAAAAEKVGGDGSEWAGDLHPQ